MGASKNRPRWDDLPPSVRADIERVVGGPVGHARNCPGGFSPGFAARITRADGRRVFVKAIDADAWPGEAVWYRTEARVTASLPAAVPAPRLLGTIDDGRWIVLALEDIDGTEPAQPWHSQDLDRVAAAVVRLGRAGTPSPVPLPREHPRLGGWRHIGDAHAARLAEHSTWAAGNLAGLVRLERAGLAAARGDSLVHFDLYPHNILLTPDRVVFVDWPHARLGAPLVDLVTVLSSAAADGIDPEPVLAAHPTGAPPEAVDAVLAAHCGFLLDGGLSGSTPGLEAIAAAKLRLGLGAVAWLRRRLTTGPPR
jgi:Ser/Thr protein kinase RdoA (MazF antagonist)